MVAQVLHHLHIISRGGMPAVQQLHYNGALPVRLKIAVDQFIPAFAFAGGGAGVAIARQIHKIDVADLIKVDGRGFARGGADARQLFAVAKLVDQAGFSHIGAPGKDQFGAVTVRKLAEQAIGGLEIGLVVILTLLFISFSLSKI